MGNLLSRLTGAKKETWSSSSSKGEGAEQGHDGSRDELGLVACQERLLPCGFTPADLTVATRQEDGLRQVRVLNWKVEDATALEPLDKELQENIKKHDTRFGSLESNVKFAEEKSHFDFAPSTEKEKPEKDLYGPFTPLTEEEEDVVFYVLSDDRSDDVLVRHEASNIEITRKILWCLKTGSWLNDEVINLYLELLKERERRHPERFLKCHFFNTFFYEKLTNTGYDFKAVRRWTTQKNLDYSLIDCDKIFIPVHKNNHWCLVVFDVREKSFQYLDSLGGTDNVLIGVLARYLMDEVKDKNDMQIDTASWRQVSVHNLPQQTNEWDCGMFMLKYIDFYSRGLNLCFNQEHMEYFRKRTVKEIFWLKAE